MRTLWLIGLMLAAWCGVAVAEGQEVARTSTGAALLFWGTAAGVIAGSIFVITRRNMVTAVMGMVGTFLCISVCYVLLYAPFLAAIQVLVYAGAIMVLFVFVVMILNKPQDDAWKSNSKFGLGATIVALLYVMYRLSASLWKINEATESQLAAPGKISVGTGPHLEQVDFGSTKAIGSVLFKDYIFPFEAVSIVLLVAVVGALAVARPTKRLVAERQPKEAA